MNQNLTVNDAYGLTKTAKGLRKSYNGEVEIIVKDKLGNVLSHDRQTNIVKIFAKDIIAHKIPHTKVWDPNAGSGSGAWVTHNLDLDEFSPKYIVFGASFDDSGNPLDSADERFYRSDSITNGFIPITLGVGAEYDGGLINAVPIAEPNRPLKRIERIFFEQSYQPSGTPLLNEDVRAMNNIIVLETTLLKSEYNGFGLTPNDFFTLTEVALVGASEIDAVGNCECVPRDIFLTGDSDDEAFLASASGSATITLDPSVVNIDDIKEGDQVKLVEIDSTASQDLDLNQLNPFYLVISKAVGGHDVTLDRVPVDVNNAPLVGDVGILRDGFRIFSHRVLKTPVKKSEDFEIVVRWRLILN